MRKEILKRYFERTGSATETQAVEDWLLDPKNKVAFEKFLEDEWDEHAKSTGTLVVKMGKPATRPIWKFTSAAAAILVFVSFGIYYMTSDNQHESAVHDNQTAAQVTTSAKLPSSTNTPIVTDTVNNFQPKTVHHEKEITHTLSQRLISKVDSTNQETKQASVPAMALTKAKINEDAIARLIQKIDSNQMVFDVNVSDAAFQQLAYIFRREYGIVLELCNDANADKTYTARFKKISIHDLLDDMSEKMAFTYSFQDNKVKICFN